MVLASVLQSVHMLLQLPWMLHVYAVCTQFPSYFLWHLAVLPANCSLLNSLAFLILYTLVIFLPILIFLLVTIAEVYFHAKLCSLHLLLLLPVSCSTTLAHLIRVVICKLYKIWLIFGSIPSTAHKAVGYDICL